ncbi:nitrogen regulation protein NR(II) [Thermodesulfobacteriota bacterium]
MNNLEQHLEDDLLSKLKWLMFFRVLFAAFLLGSTIIIQVVEHSPPLSRALFSLYGLTAAIFILSFCYTLILFRLKYGLLFAYAQVGIDTCVVTLIIYITGCSSSIFSFLYLVVIICSSILLYTKGSVFMAVSCSLQYCTLAGFEYFRVLTPLVWYNGLSEGGHNLTQLVFKVVITTAACFAVAFLTSFLSERERRTKKELVSMEKHMKRVEKMAALGEMASRLAHEVKNPLASLTGSIQLLREDGRYDVDQEKLMQIVLREADRLSSLVGDFLLYAKPPAGKIESIELDPVLTDIINLFSKDRKFAGRISVKVDFAPGIWIAMDPGHLSQIVWNLLLNSAEAIEDQGVIHIRTYPVKANAVSIRISDDGCGMPDEIIDSVFDPFFTTKHHGTGLGLSIVHSIIDSYGGRLDIESRENNGTTVTLNMKAIDSLS